MICIKRDIINKNLRDSINSILEEENIIQRIPKLNYKKIIKEMYKELNIKFLKMTLKDFLSYKNSKNKKIIDKILEQNKENKIIKIIFNLTFGDYIKIITTEDIFNIDENIKSKFHGFETILNIRFQKNQVDEKVNEEKEFQKNQVDEKVNEEKEKEILLYSFLLFNYEDFFKSIKVRKRRKRRKKFIIIKNMK